MVYDTHLIGILIPDSEFEISCQHGVKTRLVYGPTAFFPPSSNNSGVPWRLSEAHRPTFRSARDIHPEAGSSLRASPERYSCAVHIASQQIQMRQRPGSFIHLSRSIRRRMTVELTFSASTSCFLDLRHTEAELVMQSVEQPVISLLVVAEAVVETDDQILHPHLPDQISPCHETLGRNPAEGPVERNHDQIVDSEPVEQVYLLFERSRSRNRSCVPSVTRGCGAKVSTIFSPPTAAASRRIRSSKTRCPL